MVTTLISAGPGSEPLDVADVKNYLRILGFNADNDLCASLIAAARAAFENYSGRYLITQTVTQTMDAFPCGSVLTLLKGPVIGVSEIAYFANANDEEPTIISEDAYVADAASQRIVLKDGATFPTVGRVIAGAKVTYVAGFGDAASIPPSILQGMRHLIAHFYVNRETAEAIPPVVDALWYPFKVLVI
jgi:uncharacterized phiE125 gp8 family phage protein